MSIKSFLMDMECLPLVCFGAWLAMRKPLQRVSSRHRNVTVKVKRHRNFDAKARTTLDKKKETPEFFQDCASSAPMAASEASRRNCEKS